MDRNPKCPLLSTLQASLQLGRDTKSQGFRCPARVHLGPQILHSSCLSHLAPLAPAPLSDLVSRLGRRVVNICPLVSLRLQSTAHVVRSTGSTLLSKQENKIACAAQAEYAEVPGRASRSKARKEIPGQCTGKR